MTQIALSFVLLAGAGMLLDTLLALQTAQHRLRHAAGAGARRADAARASGREGDRLLRGGDAPHRRAARRRRRRARQLRAVARRRHACGRGFQFAVDGYAPADGEENPYGAASHHRARFFAVLGIPLVAGRDFNDDDRRGSEPVVIVSESVARRMFANGDAVDRQMWWTDPLLRHKPHRVASSAWWPTWTTRTWCAAPALTIYHPVQQMRVAGRLFVHAAGDPYALVRPSRASIREMSREPAGRARRDARRGARGGAGAGAAERVRVLGICRRRAADRRGRRCRRAGVLRQRAHARVRRAARDRFDAAAPAARACCRRAR